jgi:phosphoglycolate phosphatase-like HAD superfamily hydrolase
MGNACGATTIFADNGFGCLPEDLDADHRINHLNELLAIAA